MDPASTIAASVALGAAASIGNAAVSEAVKDAYKNLKIIIMRNHPKLDLPRLETRKVNLIRNEVENYLLTQTEEQSAELLHAAHNTIEVVSRYAPEAASAVGVELRDFTGINLSIDDVAATGTGVKIDGGTLAGDITIRNVRAGAKPSAS